MQGWCRSAIMKNNNNVESIIALNIIQAQMASDAGKGKKNLSLDKNLERGPMRMGYSLKETYILRALRLIRNNKTQFNYWVIIEGDQNGVPSIVVYFDFKIDGKRYQISFHNHACGEELRSMVNTGRKTRWNHEIGGSVNGCKALQNYYEISGEEIETEFVEKVTNSRRNGCRRRRR